MPNKWIELASTEAPTAEVATDVLRARMQYVQQMLPLAAREYERDVEHVHQLRVGCRRAGAALQAFRPLLKSKSKPLGKWLRRIRRAAGPARDLDVLLARMQQRRNSDPNLEYLVARLKRRRREAQQTLLKVETKARQGKLERSVDSCLSLLGGRARRESQISFRTFAKSALHKVARPIHRSALSDHFSMTQLHELRISGKRLRYSIEIFHQAFPPRVKNELYPLVEKLQSRLGQINDHVTAQTLLQSWLAQMPTNSRAAYLAGCIVEEDKAAHQARDAFLRWWTVDRVALFESHLNTFNSDRD